MASGKQCDETSLEGFLKLKPGSKCTLMTTRALSPDRILTIWSHPWQVISCVTTAWSCERFLRMKLADPPALTFSGMKLPNIRISACSARHHHRLMPKQVRNCHQVQRKNPRREQQAACTICRNQKAIHMTYDGPCSFSQNVTCVIRSDAVFVTTFIYL